MMAQGATTQSEADESRASTVRTSVCDEQTINSEDCRTYQQPTKRCNNTQEPANHQLLVQAATVF